MFRRLFFILFLAIFSFVAFHPPVAYGAATKKRLVKASRDTVYFVNQAGKRYTFPNEPIYFSWYEDFKKVEIISDEALAAIPLVGAIAYRPGTRLVKLQSDPKVYAVEPGGVLRWVPSEEIARSLYGDEWRKRVDDLSDSFFSRYMVGEPLKLGVYPEGTLLRDGQSDKYYVIWQGEKRKINSFGFGWNRFRQKDALLANVQRIPDGALLSSEEDVFSLTSQEGSGNDLPAMVTVEAGYNPRFIAQNSADQWLGQYVVSLRTATRLDAVAIKINARNLTKDADYDAGGLIYGADRQQIHPNFNRLRLLDMEGNNWFSTESLNTETSGDGTQTVVFRGNKTFAPGRQVFRLMADVSAELPKYESFGTEFSQAESVFTPVGSVSGSLPALQVVSGAWSRVVEVSKDAITVGQVSGSATRTIIPPSVGAEETLRFAIRNPQAFPVFVRSLRLHAYIDAGEGDEDFGEGNDVDFDGITAYVSQDLSEVALVRVDTGAVAAVMTRINEDGRLLFDGLNWEIPAGESVELSVRATPKANAPLGNHTDRIAFDLDENTDDIDVRDVSGTRVDYIGEQINGGFYPEYMLLIAAGGSLTIEGASMGYDIAVMGAERIPAYRFTLKAGNEEDMQVDTLTLRLVGNGADTVVGRTSLQFTVGGQTFEREGRKSVGNITFENLGWVVPRNQRVQGTVYTNVNRSNQGAQSGMQLGFTFEPQTIEARGVSSRQYLNKEDWGKRLMDNTHLTQSYMTIRKNLPVVSAGGAVEVGGTREAETPVMRFRIGSYGEDAPAVTKLVFKIEPTDVGNEGANNDLLEVLAGVNGDFGDDNDVVTLEDRDHNDPIGEGNDGTIDYAIYDASQRMLDTTPAGFESGRGDYGLVTYQLASPLQVSPSGREYELFLRTIGLKVGAQNVKVTLLGSSDFAWRDGTFAGQNGTGEGVSTLPLASRAVSFH